MQPWRTLARDVPDRLKFILCTLLTTLPVTIATAERFFSSSLRRWITNECDRGRLSEERINIYLGYFFVTEM